MAVFRQNSFIGGALSPSLEGRTDFDKRLAGARRIHNFFVTPYGTLRRRPGMRFLARVYGDINDGDVPAGADLAARLITFRGRDNVDTLIILTHMKAAALPNGRIADMVRFDAPWQGRHLRPDPFDGSKPGVKWSQSGARMLITHPEYAPRFIVAPEDPAVSTWSVVGGNLLEEAVALTGFQGEYIAAGDE